MKNTNNASRRDFLKKSSLAGIGLATAIPTEVSANGLSEAKKERGVLTEASKNLMAKFGLKYPIFQAAPGGEELTVAIANAGGMGSIQFTWISPDNAYQTTKRLNEATKGNYYANYVLHFEPKSLDKAIEAGCKNFQFSWGIPNGEIVSKIRDVGGKFGVQVSSKKNAENALALNPDFLICQGLEAGGHIQATRYVKDVFPEVVNVAGSIPVLVAGGISTGKDIRSAIRYGAAGVVMGTRLIATKESEHPDFYLQKLVEAEAKDTVYTNCYNNGGWNAMHRVLRNSTFVNWEAAGCPQVGEKPGEGEVVAIAASGREIKRYSGHEPIKGDTGDLEALCMYAGEGVKDIHDIPSAKELIERLWKEFENK